MKIPNTAIMNGIILSLFCLNLASCTVAANNPPPRRTKTAMSYKFGSILYENSDFRLVLKKGAPDNWFDGKRLRERLLTNVRKSGMPEPAIQESFESLYQTKYAMEYAMEKEDSQYAYFRAGLVFNKQTVLMIETGAFSLKLKSPSGEVSDLSDRGLVMKSGSRGNSPFLDSKKGPIKVRWGLQKVDYSKAPNQVYFRLPVQYKGWAVQSITANLAKVVVASK